MKHSGTPVDAVRGLLRNNGVVKLPTQDLTLDRGTDRTLLSTAPEGEGRDRVAASLVTTGPATNAALAKRLGISTTAVRRHLDALVAQGLAESTERPPYGPSPAPRRGRPARVFAITAAGRSQFPSDYDALASEALQFLAKSGGTEAVVAFADARAAALEQSVRDRLGDDWADSPITTKLQGLVEALSELGFAASTEPAPGGRQVCQHHCPVSHVATQFPQLCEAETEAFARLLGHHVQRLATIAHGDGVCTTVIPLSSWHNDSERTSA
jgi:predicted ArsR family transcriptional regulator